MYSKKKPNAQQKNYHNLSQCGLSEIPDDFDLSVRFDEEDADGGDDSDLEAELAAVVDGNNKKLEKKSIIVPTKELEKMISQSLKDVETDSEDDEDIENDTELLGELQGIVGNQIIDENAADHQTQSKSISPHDTSELFLSTIDLSTVDIIKQRMDMYKIAEANAKISGDNVKVRRFNRGIKTLYALLERANSGKRVNPDEIPPELSVNPGSYVCNPSQDMTFITDNSSVVRFRQAPLPPVQQGKEIKNCEETTGPKPQAFFLIRKMRLRQQEYKGAALQSKRAGDTAMALQYLKIVKQFDVVVKMYEDGKEIDISDMPPPPHQFKEFMEQMLAESGQKTSIPSTVPSSPSEFAETNSKTAGNMLEALQQRLNVYKSVAESSKSEGNASKVRRFGRIVRQYEDAIEVYQSGRPVAYDELPTPPGFGPLSVENVSMTTTIHISPTPPTVTSAPISIPNALTKGQYIPSSHNDLTTRISGNQQKNNLAEHQMKVLIERQKEFKVAAVEAKKAGEIDQAKEYLKMYKGFDALLNAASSGLPVDLNTLPVPPSQKDNLESSFAIITTEECDPNNDICDIGIRMEEQLVKQLMMCKNTRDHHKALGDIAGMNRFENLALTVQKDLDLLRYTKRKNFSLPKFHYEKRSFNIIHCNTDLTDNELEVIIVRGLNYNVSNPKDVDTYVKIEFPLPNDETFKAKTNIVKDTDSPDYDQHFKIGITRGSRQFQRIFKRHGVKLEVYSRGGFLRSDTLVGTINIKLQPLETKCDIHDTFDLIEGRKKVGGKLEVKLRVRNPILTKQMEHINEKWLVIEA